MNNDKAKRKAVFTEEEYPIQIVGRHVDISEPIKAYALEKLRKIDKFGSRIIEAYIILDIQKLVHTIEYIVDVNNTKIKVSASTNNMYASIDKASDRLERRLGDYLRWLHEHHARGAAEVDMVVNVVDGPIPIIDDINDQIEEENLKKVDDFFRPHKVVKQEKKPLKTLNQKEAVMKMDITGENFIIYRSEEDRKLKVIYRRDDGNYGIIEPETHFTK